MSDNLATIQRVKNVRHHPNADALDIVNVLGWQVVTKRDEYKDGDLCVYIVIDTVLPEKPEFEFLRNKNFRIKPIRLRGEESAGICFPPRIVPGYVGPTADGKEFFFNRKTEAGEEHGVHQEGDDVTDLLGVIHYEKPVPPELAGQMVGHFPGFLIMTDELNLRTYPDALPELWGRPYYITRKDDGCSGTYFVKGGEFGVCSRRIWLKESETNGFWRMAKKYDLERILKEAFPNEDVCIQGEVCGPGVQDNHLGLAELELHVFNLFDIKTRTYSTYKKLVEFCTKYNVPMVTTIVPDGSAFGFNIEELVKLASEQKYPNGYPAEGIVIRPMEPFISPVLKSHPWSGKVLNPLFEEQKKKK
jgi:RNA ligase (TIGR02306 family)